MSERGILFSAPMVRALLEGRKQQTRRVLKLPKWASTDPQDIEFGQSGAAEVICNYTGCFATLPMPYAVGDRLWVREAWQAWTEFDKTHADDLPENMRVRINYPADGNTWDARKRSPIHMPRWASRLTLTVTDVRVQQLLDISEDDARAEGFADGPIGDPIPEHDIGDGWTVSSPGGWASAAGHFQAYWADLHPDWDGYSSPWVCALTFTVKRTNIDPEPRP